LKKTIIVSAVNLVEGGPLTVLQECLGYLSSSLSDKYKIIALVNKKELCSFEKIKYIEFPRSKKTWVNRLYYEYYYFGKLAKRFNPYLWFSLHDITPNVSANRLAVYCHNPSPFFPLTLKDLYWGGYKFVLFKVLYRYLYAINIKKNDFIILQQSSFKDRFQKLTGAKNIIIAHPTINLKIKINPLFEPGNIFFYPAFPRVFKNFEVICRASEILLKQGIDNFQVIFTISGSENRYSRHIYNSFKHIKNIKFIGIQSRDRVQELYNDASCVIFPSQLETWGIPITEAKFFSKPILLADLEYAHETLGVYDKAKFFDPDDFGQLAAMMKDIINRTAIFKKTEASVTSIPISQSWRELFDILLSEKNNV
jgi:glycosyltransferase involved in cell wall biosynthesis